MAFGPVTWMSFVSARRAILVTPFMYLPGLGNMVANGLPFLVAKSKASIVSLHYSESLRVERVTRQLRNLPVSRDSLAHLYESLHDALLPF